MIERAITAGVPFGWVAGDEVYGGNGPLRAWLEAQHIAYVLAVAWDHYVPPPLSSPSPPPPNSPAAPLRQTRSR